ncbi:MAG: amidohydrolase family protein [Ginsengibacter sp.]
MKNRTVLIVALILFSVRSIGQTYISNVTVVDVDKQKLVPHQTVIIKDDLITGIQSSSKAKIPAGADVIDGAGKYLMPGLTDAHVHFFQSGGLYARPDAIDLRKDAPYKQEITWAHNNMEDFLRRYTMLGITSVIDVGSTIHFLQQRDTFVNKNYAPAIYMTGPLLTSYEPDEYFNLKNDEPFFLVKTPDEGVKYVQQQLPYHPDFIKIWYIAESAEAAKKFEPTAKAIIDEAHRNNLKVAVHATERLTAQLAVESGCDYLVHEVEDEIVSDNFVKLLKTKKVILCPTLTVADNYDFTFAQEYKYSAYDLINSNPVTIGSLTDLRHLPDSAIISRYKTHFSSNAVKHISSRTDSVRMVNLKKMSDAGVIIVAGTDAGNIGTQHASSLLSELKAMKASGMSTWQVIRSATINSAKIFDSEKSEGSIAVGKTANAVLLNANPIDALDNLKDIELVINRGAIFHPYSLIAETPVTIVEHQLNAYNMGNIDAFLASYSDDIELYDFPSKLSGKGKEDMRKDYQNSFTTFPGLHCEILERIVQGNVIIDKEKVTGVGPVPLIGTVIYEINNNKISKVYFIN